MGDMSTGSEEEEVMEKHHINFALMNRESKRCSSRMCELIYTAGLPSLQEALLRTSIRYLSKSHPL